MPPLKLFQGHERGHGKGDSLLFWRVEYTFTLLHAETNIFYLRKRLLIQSSLLENQLMVISAIGIFNFNAANSFNAIY